MIFLLDSHLSKDINHKQIKKMKELFKTYIGQASIIAFFLRFIARVSEKSGTFQLGSHFFSGLAGQGKSNIMEAIANAIVATDDRFQVVRIEAGQTYNDLVTHLVNAGDNYRIFIVDEVAQFLSAGKHKKSGLLRQMLETGATSRREINLGGNVFVTADRTRQVWLFASNDDPKDEALFGATGRCKVHVLENLTEDDKAKMLDVMAGRYGANITDAAKPFILSRIRPNARAVKTMAEECAVYGNVTQESAKSLCRERGFFPDGWTRADVSILSRLGQNDKGCQVNELSALTGEDSSQTSGRLKHLVAAGLVQSVNGRKVLAPAGLEYLSKLAEKQAKAKAAKIKAVK
jgi:hypothetical protein